jgi:hypothetical protein
MEPLMVEFSDFRDLFAALPSGALSLDEVRAAVLCLYEDRRIVAYYAPFDYLNRQAQVVLVGVTPGPTQMRESYEVARDALWAGRSDEDALQMVKARASFKGMRRDLARWLDELGLAQVLGLRTCGELFGESHHQLVHTTSAVRYPVFVRRRDGSLQNYSGRSPGFGAHPWLRENVETTLSGELSALPAAIVVPLGAANEAVAHLCRLGAIDPVRCLLGLPHPSPVSSRRERYFQAARTDLIGQVQRLSPDVARPPRRRLPSRSTRRRSRSDSMPKTDPIPADRMDRIVIQLTQGNVREKNSHIYLRRHLGFFPADTIGAANADDGQGTPLTLHFDGHLEPVQTDIAGDKMIFRCRGDMRTFFARHGLAEGDSVVIERLSPYEYRLTPAPRIHGGVRPHPMI